MSYPNCKHDRSATNLIYDIIKVAFIHIILHGIACVINSISISTSSFIISIKSLFDNLFCNLSYNVTAWATCNYSSREIYSVNKHKPGKIFFILIQKIDAKLELKNNPSTIANDTTLVAKSLLFVFTERIVNFWKLIKPNCSMGMFFLSRKLRFH